MNETPAKLENPRSSMRTPWVLATLALLMCGGFLVSLAIGPAAAGLGALFGQLTGGDADTAILIMREIRLPRALLAMIIGAGLGMSGAALQGLFRNPLAEPGIIGISASASLGAVIAIYTGLSVLWPFALPVLAIGFALLCVWMLQVMSRRGSALTLVLAGIAISSLAGALTSLALNLSPNPFAASEIIFWMLGSVTDRSMLHVAMAAPFILGGMVLLLGFSRDLEALTLGEEAAASLGVDLRRLRFVIVLGTGLCVGAACAVSGVIGFVGLVVPHLLRPLIGHRPALLLPASALGGALLLLLADILVRVVTPGAELRLGVVTALVGAPFFFWLVASSVKSSVFGGRL